MAQIPKIPGFFRRYSWGISNLLAVVGLVSALVWMIAIGRTTLWGLFVITPRIRVGVLLFIVLVGGLWLFARNAASGSHAPDVVSTADDEESQDITDALIVRAAIVASRYGGPALALLVDMLAEPKTYWHRLSGEVELGRRVTKRTIRTEIFIDRRYFSDGDGARNGKPPGLTRDTELLIPLIQQEKGQLFARMKFYSAEKEISSLSHGGDSMAAYIAALMYQFALVYRLQTGFDTWPETRQKQLIRLVKLTTKSAASLADMTEKLHGKGAEARLRTIERFTQHITTTLSNEGAGDSAELSKLRRIAKICLTHYVVIAQCTAQEYLNITYSYEQPTAALLRPMRKDEGSRVTRWLHDRLKVPSGYLELDMAAARHAKSFHIFVTAPHGSYVRQIGYRTATRDGQTVTQSGPVLVNNRHPISVGVPYLRRPVISGSSAHIYGRHLGRLYIDLQSKDNLTVDRELPSTMQRDLDTLALPTFSARARVVERPTGTELFAMIAACSLLLATFVFMKILETTQAKTDVAAATVALTAALAALSVFFVRALDQSLFVSTAGWTLTLTAAVLAVTNAFLFALEALGKYYWDWYWSVSRALATVLAIAAIGTFIIRLVRYSGGQAQIQGKRTSTS